MSILNGFSKFFHCWNENYFQQIPNNTFHHTFSMLLHYLTKFRSSKFGKSDTVQLLGTGNTCFHSSGSVAADVNSIDYKSVFHESYTRTFMDANSGHKFHLGRSIWDTLGGAAFQATDRQTNKQTDHMHIANGQCTNRCIVMVVRCSVVLMW